MRSDKTNEAGNRFLDQVRGIIEEAAKCKTIERAARISAFAIIIMLDGSGEHNGETYKVVTENGEDVEFDHSDLYKENKNVSK